MARLWLAFLPFVAGCATHPPVLTDLSSTGMPLELAETPFFAQRDYQCGPAALATLLVATDVEVTAEDLVDEVYLPGRRGSLQPELLAASRRHGRIPYVLDASLAALVAELEDGRPVLVLENAGLRIAPAWHYAVVVGIDPATDEIVLRSGETRRLMVPARRFLRRWERADHWAFVALRPGELPARPDHERFLSAVADVEAMRYTGAALQAYEAALARWPESRLARLGIGNVHYAAGRWPEAERAYRDMLALAPDDPVAANNLAIVLADRGCRAAALRTLDTALAAAAGDFEAILEESRREISASGAPDSDPEHCRAATLANH